MIYLKRPSSVHGCPWLENPPAVQWSQLKSLHVYREFRKRPVVRTPKGIQRSSKLLARPTDSQKILELRSPKPPNKISKNKISKYAHISSYIIIYYYILLILNHIDYDVRFRFPSGSPIEFLFDQKTSSTGWAKQLEKDGSPSSLQLSKLTLFSPRISQSICPYGFVWK